MRHALEGRIAAWSVDLLRGARTYCEDHRLEAVGVSVKTFLKR